MLIWEKLNLNVYRTLKDRGILLCLMASHGEECYASVSTLSAELGVDQRTITRQRKYLLDNGYIQKVGFRNRLACYSLTDKAKALFGETPQTATMDTTAHTTMDTVAQGTMDTNAHLKERIKESKKENVCVTEKAVQKKETASQTVTSHTHNYSSIRFEFENVTLETCKEYFDNQTHPWKKGNTVEKFFQHMTSNGWCNAYGTRYKSLDTAFMNWLDFEKTKPVASPAAKPEVYNKTIEEMEAEDPFWVELNKMKAAGDFNLHNFNFKGSNFKGGAIA